MYPKLENGSVNIQLIICQVHFWLQRSDNVYLLLRIAYKEKYVFLQLNLFPECLNHLYHRSPIPLIRIEELLKKKRIKKFISDIKWYFGEIEITTGSKEGSFHLTY